MNEKRFSIVTICLNEEKNIADTLESVLAQTYINYEYIIKDGDSRDQTNEIIKKYKKKFEKKGILFTHIIQKDAGIYDAMNQAALTCCGDWINFMNAGDQFYNKEVLFDLSIYIAAEQEKIGVLYGHTFIQVSKGHAFIMNHHIKDIKVRCSISHQSSFIHIDVMKQFPFDCNFVIAGDYDQFLRIEQRGVKFKNCNIIIANVNRDGISNTNKKLSMKEQEILFEKYNLNKNKKTVKAINIIKAVIVKIMPPIEKIFFVKNNMKNINDTISISGENND